jgi:UDP:flavonoid glycosyltransferase YjiC (YdhE family)
MTAHRRAPHIVFTPCGSLGDLHPSLAIGRALAARGARVTVVTHAEYRERVEQAGFAHRTMPPALTDVGDFTTIMERSMDGHRGSEFVMRSVVMPFLRGQHAAIAAAAVDADLLVGHSLTLTTATVAEARGLPWASVSLQPYTMFSSVDPPLVGDPVANALFALGPWARGPLLALARVATGHWFAEHAALRREAGLAHDPRHPLLEQSFSPHLHLAAFSSALMPPRADWPAVTVQTGFPWWDDGARPTPELAAWLDAGEPPVLFTLGSAAVHAAGDFWDAAVAACAALGRRALLLVGEDTPTARRTWPAHVRAVAYAAHAEVMPRAAVIVHQGGIGTTAQALRAGRPMLVVPFSHDQPDNARRCARLGVAAVLARHRVTAGALAAALQPLLADPAIAAAAAAVGAQVRDERGAEQAATHLLALLDGPRGAA